ncbi:hypothetical protein PMX22_19680 [Clostridium butyricum]|uniref:hypothetical protein n=1 Tax=Clostridium butyricum TaxID=1492 RepID=UPI00232EBD57|nr:hypothetical protein [Clostridium butyricum]MDB2162009.1 hypothetical protein [Clostridium butyricum]
MIKCVKEIKLNDVLDLGGNIFNNTRSVCTLVSYRICGDTYELNLKSAQTGEYFTQEFKNTDNIVVW